MFGLHVSQHPVCAPVLAAAKLLARLHKLEIILASKKAKSTASIDDVTDPKLQRTLQTGIVTAGAPTYVLTADMCVPVPETGVPSASSGCPNQWVLVVELVLVEIKGVGSNKLLSYTRRESPWQCPTLCFAPCH